MMNNGKYFPAEFALTEKYGILVEGSNPVFPAKVQTINLRIEVFDLSPSLSYLSSDYHVAVARLRRMGIAGENLVLWFSTLIKPRRRSEL